MLGVTIFCQFLENRLRQTAEVRTASRWLLPCNFRYYSLLIEIVEITFYVIAEQAGVSSEIYPGLNYISKRSKTETMHSSLLALRRLPAMVLIG